MSTSVSGHPVAHIPEAVARVADLMVTFGPKWALCGGWAVDAWLGRLTRDHADTDIVIFLKDQRAFLEHMAGWQLVAHDTTVDGGTADPWNGRPLDLPAHIHARFPVAGEQLPDRVDNATGQGFGLDVQMNERSGGDWILSREPLISVPLTKCIQQSAWGVPTVVPEVLLFYKATAYFGREELMTGGRYQDEPDFLMLLGHLSEEQRRWLREAISRLHPGHPWLAQLS